MKWYPSKLCIPFSPQTVNPKYQPHKRDGSNGTQQEQLRLEMLQSSGQFAQLQTCTPNNSAGSCTTVAIDAGQRNNFTNKLHIF
jgi:hypothetical protein